MSSRLCGSVLSCLVLAACSSGLELAPPLEPTAAGGSLRVAVASGRNDAEEVGGRTQLNGLSLDFSGGTAVGLRFEGVRIPQGARIRDAYIEFRAAGASSGPLTLTVRGDDSAYAQAFSGARISSRAKTSASSTWYPNAWTPNKVTRSSSVVSIVEEVVGRSDWKSGSALAFTVTGSSGAKRSAISYNKSRRAAPTLVVTFGEGGSAPPSSRTGAREWYQRLKATLSNPRYSGNAASLDPVRLAASGDLYKLGRNFNNYATSLILAYRETGDRDLVRQLDRVMNIARGKLRDTDGDDYKNWRYLNKSADSSSRPFYGGDTHVMDEMLTHSVVAAVAYTFKQAGYSSSASYWTDYLKNDFEAKWRERNRKPSGFPFISKDLMHPYVQFIRYHFYMYKLTGQGSYYTEARRMAGVVKRHMRTVSTPGGRGYTWLHGVTEGGGRGSRRCQPTVYVRYTTQAFADLATAGSGFFDATFMKRVANTMAYRVLKNAGGTQLSEDVCGSGTYGSVWLVSQYPYSQLAPWDGSGRLRTAAERAYAATERWNLASPVSYNIPATMVFTLGR